MEVAACCSLSRILSSHLPYQYHGYGMSLTGHFYTCSDKILCGLGRMYAGGGELTENIDDVGGEKVTLEKACGMGLPEL